MDFSSFFAKKTVGTATPAPVVMITFGRFINTQNIACMQFMIKLHFLAG
ncbi:hypothetical protein M099_0177 [Phocaeicola vulgatus str. 3975 RP4]|uniref:Uncharacterized protein n=1 Tax=Phocaeicola vulgatus str. 3975 RP4 TaxID=1339352 RepID=A0A069SWM3_PHOVU|nr:hypothetical protein M098_0343 [Phocaeicola vulgatus str. 3775 SR(B) 19]KDS56626.1 hypothetical protein M099_0177 [Phocaeicola vulgatus str. 3975 RP4]